MRSHASDVVLRLIGEISPDLTILPSASFYELHIPRYKVTVRAPHHTAMPEPHQDVQVPPVTTLSAMFTDILPNGYEDLNIHFVPRLCIYMMLEGRSQGVPDTVDAVLHYGRGCDSPVVLGVAFGTLLCITLLTAGHRYQGNSEHSSVRGRQDIANRPDGQGLPSSSSHVAVPRWDNNGKRTAAEAGFDGGHHDRGKTARVYEWQCPYAVKYPGVRQFKKCGTFTEWRTYREHLVVRKHRRRDQCTNCGELFKEDDKWDVHTRLRECQSKNPEEFESVFGFVTRVQDNAIRALKQQGKRPTKSDPELCGDVWEILFPGESCTVWPYSINFNAYAGGANSHTILGNEDFLEEVSNMEGMKYVPEELRGQLAWRCYLTAQSYLNDAGRQAPVAGRIGDDIVHFQHSTASSSGVQAPQISAAIMRDSAGPNTPLVSSHTASYPGNWETDPSLTGASSLLSHYLQGSVGHSEAAWTEAQLGKSVGSDPNSFDIDPFLLQMEDPQPPKPISPTQISPRPPIISMERPSVPGEHQEGMPVHWGPSQGHYPSLEGIPHDGYPTWINYHLPPGGENAEQD